MVFSGWSEGHSFLPGVLLDSAGGEGSPFHLQDVSAPVVFTKAGVDLRRVFSEISKAFGLPVL